MGLRFGGLALLDSKARASMCSNSPGAPPTSSTPCMWGAERLSLSTFRKAHSLWTPRWGDEAGARSRRPWSRCQMPAQTPWICAPQDTRLALFQNTQKKLERFANRAAIHQKDELSSDKLIRRGAASFRPLLFLLFKPCVPTQIARIALRYLCLVSEEKPGLAEKAHRPQVYGHPLSIGIFCRSKATKDCLGNPTGLREQGS
jgi:hypothetical protein